MWLMDSVNFGKGSMAGILGVEDIHDVLVNGHN